MALSDPEALVRSHSLRGYRLYLESVGLLPQVQAKLSGRSAEVLANSRSVDPWTPCEVLEEIFDVVFALKGEDFLRQMARTMVQDTYSPLLRTTLKSLLGLVGGSPAVLFSRANMVLGLYERGTAYSYVASSSNSGTIEFRSVHAVRRPGYVVREGLFAYAFDVTRVPNGWVRLEWSDPRGHLARFAARW